MIVKNELTPVDMVRQILEDQHGTLRTSDLVAFNIPRTYLCILEREGEIERVSRGVYRATNAIEDEMFAFQAVYKASVYSHQTALYLHDLTDRSPLAYSISVPVGYHSVVLNNSLHEVFYVRPELFDLGVISMQSPHGNSIQTTNLERTICDIVRSRNQIDSQLVYDGLRRYVKKGGKNLSLLYHYAERFRVQRKIREMVEVLL